MVCWVSFFDLPISQLQLQDVSSLSLSLHPIPKNTGQTTSHLNDVLHQIPGSGRWNVLTLIVVDHGFYTPPEGCRRPCLGRLRHSHLFFCSIHRLARYWGSVLQSRDDGIHRAFDQLVTEYWLLLGNLIGRGVLEFCDGGPPVKNFISLGGPHAGTASVPLCGSGIFCILADALIKSEIYTTYVQDHLAPSGYLKIPTDIDDYLEGCKFLPKLNNEIPSERNSTYKKRFSSLETLVLIMFDQDTVLIPKETSWFGYYPDGAFSPILPPQETTLYKEDWIGLKSLDDAGRVRFVSVSGNHLGISDGDMKKYIVPYLEDRKEDKEVEVPFSSLNYLYVKTLRDGWLGRLWFDGK